MGLIIKLTKTIVNTHTEWGYLRQMAKGICLRLSLSKSGGGMYDIER